MTAKNTKKITKSAFNECALTGVVFDGRFSPLRLSVDDNRLTLELTDKKNRKLYLYR